MIASLYGLILAQTYFFFTAYHDHFLFRLVVILLWSVRFSRFALIEPILTVFLPKFTGNFPRGIDFTYVLHISNS